MGCLIVVGSITYAQRLARLFSSHGIALSVIKPPVSLGHGSCSYALRIKEADLQKTAALLSGISIKIKGIYVVENGKYREAEI